jgi:hypothetical protein
MASMLCSFSITSIGQVGILGFVMLAGPPSELSSVVVVSGLRLDG